MRKFICSIMILIFPITFVLAQNTKLVLSHGSILLAYHNDNYKEIFRSECFYGFGLLNDTLVFVASQSETTAEAVADISVINLATQEKKAIESLGGAGESRFDINPLSKDIVFNDSEGIKIMRIDPKDYLFSVNVIKENIDCFGIFWEDEDTIGFLNMRNSKFERLKTD